MGQCCASALKYDHVHINIPLTHFSNDEEKTYRNQMKIPTSKNQLDEDGLDLPDDLAKIAFREFGETPYLRNIKIKDLSNAISNLPIEDRINDLSSSNLVRFLRGKKYNMEKCIQATINLARFSRLHPELVKKSSAQEFIMFSELVTILNDRDPSGRVIVLLQPLKVVHSLDPSNISKHPHIIPRLQIWIFETLSKNVYVQVCCVCTRD